MESPVQPTSYQSPREKAILSRRSFIGMAGTAALALATGALTGCSSEASGASDTAGKKITVAFTNAGYPTAYLDDSGNPAGYEIDVLKRVEALLADYDFSYEGVDQIAVFAGLSSGKYDVGLTNSFWTPKRAETYLTPSQNIGVSVLGFLTRKEFADITTLEQAAKAKLRLAPITAGDGNYFVVEDYNSKHPDAQIELTATDDANAFTEAFGWVAEKRHDFTLVPLQYYDALVVDEDGPYHQYKDILAFSIIGATKTWSFLAKGRESFEADYSGALKQLKDDGTLAGLAKQWYGINNFEYLTDDSQNYNYL
ncbi:MAG: transporter substrate-binding domain-containing protein [Coriobacteriaceae bacterium]|jgi:L-cystine transport system substrate-binding protein|nr:transporter substrate-binding domain-containing protein [Coriobacteriaceae bacterium]